MAITTMSKFELKSEDILCGNCSTGYGTLCSLLSTFHDKMSPMHSTASMCASV